MLKRRMDKTQIPESAANLTSFCEGCEKPELQMLILARLAGLALCDDPKTAMAAANMLMEITGNDVRSQLALEQRELDWAKMALDWERHALEREKIQPKNADFTKVDEMMDLLNRAAGMQETGEANEEKQTGVC